MENRGEQLLELMERKRADGTTISFVRGHYDMGNAIYGMWLQDMGYCLSMKEDKAGDMVEALLSFNWWQERSLTQLQEMGDMATFHKEVQGQHENVNAAHLQVLDPGTVTMRVQDSPVRANGQLGQRAEDQETEIAG